MKQPIVDMHHSGAFKYNMWLRLKTTYEYLGHTFLKEFDVSKFSNNPPLSLQKFYFL
jgi:hypothetical protein